MTIQVAYFTLPIKSFGGFGTTEGLDSWNDGTGDQERSVALETRLHHPHSCSFICFRVFYIGLNISRDCQQEIR
jgi:hypothetical protein